MLANKYFNMDSDNQPEIDIWSTCCILLTDIESVLVWFVLDVFLYLYILLHICYAMETGCLATDHKSTSMVIKWNWSPLIVTFVWNSARKLQYVDVSEHLD